VQHRSAGILGVLEEFFADRIARIAVNKVMAKVLNQRERIRFETAGAGHGDVPQQGEPASSAEAVKAI
jgi:hypothetical protein